MPFIDYVNTFTHYVNNAFVDCVDTSVDYTDTSIDFTHTYDDYVNTSVNSIDAPYTLASNFISQISFFCNYHLMIISWSKVLKSILFWP